MILQILSRTPPWVFVLFAFLIVLGVVQLQTREIGRKRVVMLPAAFVALSLWGGWSAFGADGLAYAGWAAGIGAALLLNQVAKLPRKVTYSAQTRRFRIEGSWTPLALMMTIFFTRYAIAVMLAMQPGL